MDNKAKKAAILKHCETLRETMIYGNKLETERFRFVPNLPMGYMLSGVNFMVQVGESVHEDDIAWSLAAVLIGEDTQQMEADKQTVFDGWDNGLIGISGEDHEAQPIVQALKRVLGREFGMEAQRGQ